MNSKIKKELKKLPFCGKFFKNRKRTLIEHNLVNEMEMFSNKKNDEIPELLEK